MYAPKKLARQRKRWEPATAPSEPSHAEGSSLAPPATKFSASPPIQRTEETPAADPKREEKAASAVTWALETAKLSSFSVEQLQRKLGLGETGDYDLETARSVYDLQKSWGQKNPDAMAGKGTFSKLGIVLVKEYEAASYNQGFWGNFLDEQGSVRPEFSGGISVAVYPHYKNQSNNNKEFLRQAAPWAKRHQAVGVGADGGLQVDIPIPIKSTGEVIEKVNSISEGIFNMLVDNYFTSDAPSISSQASKIKNLGIFAHGMPYGLSLEEDDAYALVSHDRGANRKANVDSFVEGLSPSLASGVNVQLFACNTGRAFNKANPLEKEKYEHWQVTAKGGENSFGAMLAEQLGQDATVYSHLTAGHTTRNFAAVVFGKEAGADNGTHLFNLLYPEEFIQAELERLFPTMEEPARIKAKVYIFKEMASHYKDTTSREVSEIDPNFKGVSTNMGAEMFTDLGKSKGLFQEHWRNKWIADATKLKALTARLKKAGLV